VVNIHWKEILMEFNTGEIISFVLTTFSLVITIIPIIAPPSGDNLSSTVVLSRAVTNIIEHRLGPTGLFAHNLLHDSTPNNLVFRPQDTNETNLARAVIHYNDNNLTSMLEIWKCRPSNF
jgi:ABC-type transport system involved in cytochrome c biogenesis permease component